MPAYNAEGTLQRTYEEVTDQDYVDLVIVVDDASRDRTVSIARQLERVKLHVHPGNLGDGANQKPSYRIALEEGADIVIMVHPDYQYTPKLIPALVSLLGNELYDCVLGSRILGGAAISGGMPKWRYVANRFLTLVQNAFMRTKLSEFHTGYRGFTRQVLATLPLETNSDDFVFDSQMLAQVFWFGFRVGEVSCPTRYAPDGSSISFLRAVKYGFGCLWTTLQFRLARMRLIRTKRFPRQSMDVLASGPNAQPDRESMS